MVAHWEKKYSEYSPEFMDNHSILMKNRSSSCPGGPKWAELARRGAKTPPKGGQGVPIWSQGVPKGAPRSEVGREYPREWAVSYNVVMLEFLIFRAVVMGACSPCHRQDSIAVKSKMESEGVNYGVFRESIMKS